MTTTSSWTYSASKRYMSPEEQDNVYWQSLRDYEETLRTWTAVKTNIRQIGESFKGFGTALIDNPMAEFGHIEAVQAAYDADIAKLPDLQRQFSELRSKLAELEKQVQAFGRSMPKFDWET